MTNSDFEFERPAQLTKSFGVQVNGNGRNLKVTCNRKCKAKVRHFSLKASMESERLTCRTRLSQAICNTLQQTAANVSELA